MGLRQSAQVKMQQPQLTQKKISLADFRLRERLEHHSTGFIYNWIVEQRGNPEPLIMKVIPKLQLYNDKKIKAYIKQLFLMASLPHPFLVQPYYAFQDQNNLYLVLEYVSGGDLRSQIQPFSEDQARILIAQLLTVLEYLHQHNIVHTNICPSNVLLHPSGYVKLYGLHASCEPGDFKVEDEVNEYLAPEVLLREEFGCEADFYSLGMMLYEIMIQRRLLQESEEVFDLILNKCVQVMKSELPEGWSGDAADFINKLIQKNPKYRLGHFGIQDIKRHKWLSGITWPKIESKQQRSTYVPRVSREEKSNQRLMQLGHPMVQNQEFQNLFSLFYFRWDEEVKEIDYKKFL